MSEDLVLGEENLEQGQNIEEVEEVDIEMPSDLDYIQAAYFALSSVEDMDTQLMSKQDEIRVKRIKRKALVIIDECLKSLYDEIIEETKDEE